MKHTDIINSLSLEQKCALLSGGTVFTTRALPGKGIPAITLSDGPNGVRKQAGAADHLGLNPSVPATCFPTSATVANNYYGSARSTLEAKAKAGADYFNSYSMSSYSEYYRNASLYAASFDSTRIELQFLNLYGRVDNSTQGVAAGTAPQTPEIARALESGSIVLDSAAGRYLQYGSYTTPEFAMPPFCNLNVLSLIHI